MKSSLYNVIKQSSMLRIILPHLGADTTLMSVHLSVILIPKQLD